MVNPLVEKLYSFSVVSCQTKELLDYRDSLSLDSTSPYTELTEKEHFYIHDEHESWDAFARNHDVEACRAYWQILEEIAPVAKNYMNRVNDYFYVGHLKTEPSDMEVFTAKTPRDFITAIFGCYRKDIARFIFTHSDLDIVPLMAVSRLKGLTAPENQCKLIDNWPAVPLFGTREEWVQIKNQVSPHAFNNLFKTRLAWNLWSDYQELQVDKISSRWLSVMSKRSHAAKVEQQYDPAIYTHEGTITVPVWVPEDVHVLSTPDEYVKANTHFAVCLLKQHHLYLNAVQGQSFVGIVIMDNNPVLVEFNEEEIFQAHKQYNEDLSVEEWSRLIELFEFRFTRRLLFAA